MQTSYKVHFKPRQVLKIFFYSMLLLPVCFVLISVGFTQDGIFAYFFTVIGLLGLLFFLPLLFYLFIAVITRRPAFIFSKEGITDKSQLYGSGFMKWEDIKKITIGGKHTITYLSIEMYEPEVLKKQSSGLKRLYLWVNKSLTAVQTQVDVSRLEISEANLILLLSKYSNGKFNAENITETNVDEWLV